MPRIRNWDEAIDKLRQVQKENAEILLKVEGAMEGIEKTMTSAEGRAITTAFRLIAKLVRIDEADHLFILELLSDQAREMEAVKSIVASLASEKEELSEKIEEMNEWREQRERMLREIDKIVKERKKRKRFLDEHR